MQPLATLDDLQARMGRVLTDDFQLGRAEALLRDASAAFRRAAGGQEITRSTSTVRVTPPQRGALLLPQWPVNNVTAVASTTGTAQLFLWDGVNLFTGPTMDGVVGNLAEAAYDGGRYYNGRLQPVDVTYDHGYNPIPDDVIAVVCQIVGRAIGRPVEDSGVQQESIGGYAYTTGVAAAAGGVGMLNDERRIAVGYRRPAGVVNTRPRF